MKVMLQHESDIRWRLVGLVDQNVSDEDWDYLREEGHVGRVVSGEKDLNWLGERFFRLRQRLAGPPPAPSQADREMTEYIGSLLYTQLALFMAIANRDRRVVAFREQILGGRLLTQDEVEPWIREQASRDGKPAMWVTVVLPHGHTGRFTDDGRYVFDPPLTMAAESIEQVRWRLLPYVVPGARLVRREQIANGGVLDRLYHLSEQLAERFEWSQPHSVMFVLTGTQPFMSSYEADVKVGKGLRPKVTLNLDLSFPPSRVAAVYRSIQARYLDSGVRKLSTKHLMLARAMADWPRSMPWQKRMEEWNRQYRKWPYTHESNFRRDSLKARERVLGMSGPDIEDLLHRTESETVDEMTDKALATVPASVLGQARTEPLPKPRKRQPNPR
jgi:hypothetical protein